MLDSPTHATSRRSLEPAIVAGAALVTAAAILIALSGHGAVGWLSARTLTGWFLLIAALAVAAAAGLAARRLREQGRAAGRGRALALWLPTAAVFAVVLCFAVPIPSAVPPLPPQTVSITATGERNPDSQGSEVWVYGLVQHGEERASIRGLRPDDAWERRGQVYVSYRRQPGTLQWVGALRPESALVLRGHALSGIVHIAWNGRTERIDLYAPESTEVRIPLGAGVHSSPAWRVCVALADGWLLALALWLGGGWCIARGDGRPVRSPRRGAWLAYAAPCAIVWSVYLMAFWPAVLSPDSIAQWEQMTAWRLIDDHPYMHTLTVWLFTRPWEHPAAAAAAQIVVLSCVVGAGLSALGAAGVPAAARWGTSLLIALAPCNGALAITLWKDVLFSAALLLMTVQMVCIVHDRARTLGRIHFLAGVFVATLAVALYRHNGFPVAFGALALLGVAARGYRLRIAVLLLLAMATWYGARGPLREALGVRPSPMTAGLFMLHHLAAHHAAGTMTAAEADAFERIYPEARTWSYTPYMARFLPPPDRRYAVMRAHRAELDAIFRSTLLRHPEVNLRHVLRNSSHIWRITRPPGSADESTAILRQDDRLRYVATNQIGLEESSLVPNLAWKLARWGQWPESPWYVALWKRNGLWLCVAVGAVVLAALRRWEARCLLIAAPLVLNSAILAVGVPMNNFRYAYPAYLAGMLLIALPWLRGREAGAAGA